MAGALAGVTRSPFTAIIFAFELTHDANSLLALLVVATVSHLVSVLVLKRSILTEKVARRGFHVMREYAVDPLEATFVREVMDTDVFTVEPTRPLSDIYRRTGRRLPRTTPTALSGPRRRRANWSGILPWSSVLAARATRPTTCSEAMIAPTAIAYPDEILRSVADRMAEHRYRRDSRGRPGRHEAPRWAHHPVRPPPGPPEAPRRGAPRRASADTATCRSADLGADPKTPDGSGAD